MNVAFVPFAIRIGHLLGDRDKLSSQGKWDNFGSNFMLVKWIALIGVPRLINISHLLIVFAQHVVTSNLFELTD